MIFELIIPILTLILIGYFLYDSDHAIGYEELDRDLQIKALTTFPQTLQLHDKETSLIKERVHEQLD